MQSDSYLFFQLKSRVYERIVVVSLSSPSILLPCRSNHQWNEYWMIAAGGFSLQTCQRIGSRSVPNWSNERWAHLNGEKKGEDVRSWETKIVKMLQLDKVSNERLDHAEHMSLGRIFSKRNKISETNQIFHLATNRELSSVLKTFLFLLLLWYQLSVCCFFTSIDNRVLHFGWNAKQDMKRSVRLTVLHQKRMAWSHLD